MQKKIKKNINVLQQGTNLEKLNNILDVLSVFT